MAQRVDGLASTTRSVVYVRDWNGARTHLQFSILILGASYGSLLATKLILAGHDVRLVCLPVESDLINREGTRVRMPVRNRTGLVEVDSRKQRGRLTACTPEEADVAQYDLVALAMQEPQYQAPSVRGLLQNIARAGVPCMSIMNMPPLAFLARIPGLDTAPLRRCYAEPSVWDPFDPSLFTLASPDPQAFRPPEEGLNVLQVSLPTNFKVAPFGVGSATDVLRHLQRDIEAVRYRLDGEDMELPVKLKVHDSIFVPLAKWSMLLSGNYRCVQPDGPRSIAEAVHSDIEKSRQMYEWVAAVCHKLGASSADLVPFEKYAAAAKGLAKPSSAARALFAGARNIERVDLLVQGIARQHGMESAELNAIVGLVDKRLEMNRRAAAQ
jgi:hypothetical protein